MFKYTKNGKIVGLSNAKTISSDPGIVETEISTEEYAELLRKERDFTRAQTDAQNWFEGYYSQHEQKYRRFIDLGIMCDDGSDPIEKLKALQLEAEEKRKKIQNFENLLKNL